LFHSADEDWEDNRVAPDTAEIWRRSTVAQITLTQEEVAILRNALSIYLSDLRMEVSHTDSSQFRENLKHEEVVLKKLLQQLDAELSAASS
jgi:hypothetical protein